MSVNLVILKTFDNEIDAFILKSKLESEGIECFIFDNNTATINPLYIHAIGGIKLKVDEKDKEKALIVLEEIEQLPYTNEQNEEISCERCQSTRIISGHRSFKGAGGIFSAIFSFFLGVLPIYFKRVYRCKDCGHEFNTATK